MEDASTVLCERAYSGRWLEEDVPTRRLRLQVMQRATRPSQPTSLQLGPINLALCQGTLRSWFSYLQVLINTTQHDEDGARVSKRKRRQQ